jgi:hypothetical protein
MLTYKSNFPPLESRKQSPTLNYRGLRALKAYAGTLQWPARYFVDHPHPDRKLWEAGYLRVFDGELCGDKIKLASITEAGRAALSRS